MLGSQAVFLGEEFGEGVWVVFGGVWGVAWVCARGVWGLGFLGQALM